MNTENAGEASRGFPSWVGVLWVVGLLFFFGFWSGSGIGTLSPTIDEPLHAVGAWHARFAGDFRVDREDPALWLRYVGLFQARGDVRVTYDQGGWEESGHGATHPMNYFRSALYTDSRAPGAVVREGRWASLCLAVALGASVAWMAWRLAGPCGGVAAAVAFALEPLMLGHGAIIKNDVAIALCYAWAAWWAWRAAEGRWAGVVGLVVAMAVMPLVKFSGPALAGFAMVPLVARAALGGAWRVGGVRLGSAAARLGLTVGMALASAVLFWGLAWVCYDFRFAPSPDGQCFDLDQQVLAAAKSDLRAKGVIGLNASRIDREALAAWSVPVPIRVARWVDGHRLLPQAYVDGLAYTYASTLSRRGFLLGELGVTGWWYYFPVAWWVKSPVTMTLAIGAGAAYALRGGRWRRHLFLVVPAALYVGSAMAGRLDIGLRHLLPAYPFLMVGLGMFVSATWTRRGRAIWLAGAVVLALEVVPHRLGYVQFFNAPVGGARGGLALLGDSNLDWGQDLYLLSRWQAAHPGVPLYANVFAPVVDARSARLTLTPRGVPGPAGVYAISATRLQGIYEDAAGRETMRFWREQPPIEVLGGTIYLFKTDGAPR